MNKYLLVLTQKSMTSKHLQIIPYTEKYFDGFTQLLKRNFWVISSESDLIQWKFFSTSRKSSILLAIHNKKPIAQYSNLETEIFDGKKSSTQWQSIDMCTDKEFRKQWIQTILSKEYYASSNKNFTFGFSNKQWVKVDQNSKSYGYKVIWELTKIYVFPMLAIWENPYIFKEATEIPHEITPVPSMFQIQKSFSYLEWRYILHPFHKKYTFYNVTTKNWEFQWYIVVKQVGQKMYIMDVILSNDSKKKEILKSFICSKKRKLTTMYIFIVLDNPYWEEIIPKSLFTFYRKSWIYFTLRNSSSNNPSIENKDKWIVQLGDII